MHNTTEKTPFAGIEAGCKTETKSNKEKLKAMRENTEASSGNSRKHYLEKEKKNYKAKQKTTH